MDVLKSYDEVLSTPQPFYKELLKLGDQCKVITKAAAPLILARNPLYTVIQTLCNQLGQGFSRELVSATVLQVSHQLMADFHSATSDFRVYFNRPALKDNMLEIVPGISVLLTKMDPKMYILSGYLYMTKAKKLAIYFEYRAKREQSEVIRVCAIDVDTHPVLIDSDGSSFANTENYTAVVSRILSWEQQLENKQPNSRSYADCASQIRNLKNRAHQIRMDAFHKLVNAYVKAGDLLIVADKPRMDLMTFDLEHSMYCSNLFIRILERQAKASGVPFYRVPISQIYSAIANKAHISYDAAESYIQQCPMVYLETLYNIGNQLLMSLKETERETTQSDKTCQFSELE